MTDELFDIEHLINKFSSNNTTGLTSNQVEINRQLLGSNILTPPKKDSWLKQYCDKFIDPTIIILCICAFIAITIGLFNGEIPWDGVAILVAVGIATAGRTWSEYKADKAFEFLKKDSDRIVVKITRNGEFCTVNSSELVVGDIIHLESGDKIPADAVIIRSVDLIVDESLMTGESAPLYRGSKNPDLVGGTYIVAGNTTALITIVGDKTELGNLASSLGFRFICPNRSHKKVYKELGQCEVCNKELKKDTEPPTPLQDKFKLLANQISKIGVFFAVLIFLALLGASIYNNPEGLSPPSFHVLFDCFMVAITIIVVAVPEGLPMAVTIVMASGMRKIRQDNNLVRKMTATETIGAVTVICSDKTGTLTQNKMQINKIYCYGKYWEGEALNKLKNNNIFPLISLSCAVNSTAEVENIKGEPSFIGNPTEKSLLLWLHNLNVNYADLRSRIKVDSRICFSSERKMMTTFCKQDHCKNCLLCSIQFIDPELSTIFNEQKGCNLILTKGAPDKVLPLCNTVLTESGIKPIDDFSGVNPYFNIHSSVISMAESSIRPLAIAFKCSRNNEPCDHSEDNLTLLAIIGISDTIRSDVPHAIEVCRRAGISVRMVTGDHIETARAVAKEIGLMTVTSDIVMTGESFAALGDEEASAILSRLVVLARSRPLDKERLVRLLQEQGQVVTVTGDGTNDAQH